VPAGDDGRGCHVVDAMISEAGHIDSVYAYEQAPCSRTRTGRYDLDAVHLQERRERVSRDGDCNPECWRLQVFGSKGWAEMGSVPHLTTWTLRRCYLEQPMESVEFSGLSTERAELKPSSDAIDAASRWATTWRSSHNSAVLEAIVRLGRERPSSRALTDWGAGIGMQSAPGSWPSE